MRLADHYRSVPFLYLLIAMLVLILLSPIVEGHSTRVPFIQILFTAIVGAAVYAASARRHLQFIAVALAIPWLILSWLNELDIWRTPFWIAGSLVISLNVFVGCIVFRRVTTAREIDLNILSGGLALYLLLAISWAVSFVLIESFAPGSFTTDETPIPWHRHLYFSLTTITTLGYGDILPVSPFARIWATMEAVTGVMYVAVLVARLVSLYRS